MSVPALLARFDERKIVSLVAAINGGMAILAIGIIAYMTRLPLLFPAMGPSCFIMFSTPLSPGATPRSVILGHCICLLTGVIVWHIISFLCGNTISPQMASWPLYLSASLALAISALLLVRMSCPHPPACASSLVVAIGAVTGWQNIILMMAVIVYIAWQGFAINRLAGIHVPIWSKDDSLTNP